MAYIASSGWLRQASLSIYSTDYKLAIFLISIYLSWIELASNTYNQQKSIAKLVLRY